MLGWQTSPTCSKSELVRELDGLSKVTSDELILCGNFERHSSGE
jgi:hypothetical protein